MLFIGLFILTGSRVCAETAHLFLPSAGTANHRELPAVATPPRWVTQPGELDRNIAFDDAKALAEAQALAPLAVDHLGQTVSKLTKESGNFVASEGCKGTGSYTNKWMATDDAGNKATHFIQVIRLVDRNKPPVIHQAKDIKVYINSDKVEILLTGIDPVSGCGPQQTLNIKAHTSDPWLITKTELLYSGGSTARLQLQFAPDTTGSAKVIISLKDNGGILFGGEDTAEMEFTASLVTVGEGPKLEKPVPHLIGTPGQAIGLNLSDYFSPFRHNDKLTYGITLPNGSPLPAWIFADNFSGNVSGTVPDLIVRPIDIIIRATDSYGLTTRTKTKIGTTLPGKFSLSCFLNTSLPADKSGVTIRLFRINEDNLLQCVEEILPDETASALFYGLDQGEYSVKAEISDSLHSAGFMNTWYLDAASPLEARNVDGIGTLYASIEMGILQREKLAGANRVTGKVLLVPGPGKPAAEGVPLPGVDITLIQNGRIIDNLCTDETGRYTFQSLPEGLYSVGIANRGYSGNLGKNLIFGAGRVHHASIDFSVWKSTGQADNDLEESAVSMAYPNPTDGMIIMDVPQDSGITLEVTDASGVPVFRKGFTKGEVVVTDLTGHKPGIYLMQAKTAIGRYVAKIILKEK